MSSAPTPLFSSSALSRLRVVQRSFLTRRGGRHVARTAVAVEYRPSLQRRISGGDGGNYERVIDAEVLHGDEQVFWGERRGFYRRPVQYFPTWDRLAQALILITRQVPRVPQEMAFRLMAVFLKLMLLPQLVMSADLMLPSWVATNAEGVLAAARKDDSKNDTTTTTTTKNDNSNSNNNNNSSDKKQQ
ncbi:uncharacterized protein TM35_000282010 [Trypanosoma theileri]|uniref:Uncharacterized protein n=1 Tax=Trypanosoma theileri TaxID=67003 RepID=A0A1X0NP61_9TRYP|nr:uncharacterized protein TM35_000282010 [Trypanosoma theileri]ORC86485.1 hypothetical protein TM35_000282010 [Trypanosoma theileri]